MSVKALKKIGVLVSGGGTNFQSLIDTIHHNYGEIAVVISNNRQAFGLERGRAAGIPAVAINPKGYSTNEAFDQKIVEILSGYDVDLVVLAGYMKILPESIVGRFPRRIINIHPSLIPRFCGEGFYGMRVHRAVLEAGETTSGATVHYVDEGVDTGEVLLQERVPVLRGDTPESLAARVLETEHRILPEVIGRLSREVK